MTMITYNAIQHPIAAEPRAMLMDIGRKCHAIRRLIGAGTAGDDRILEARLAEKHATIALLEGELRAKGVEVTREMIEPVALQETLA